MKRNYDLNELEKEAAVICRDFALFCDYIIKNKVKVAKRTGNIGKQNCFELNMLFHVKEEVEKPSYLQNRYPIINFFYFIAVRYKILEINSAGTVLQQGTNYQCFCEASIWEQYLLFLAVFLFDGTFAGREEPGYTDRVVEMWEDYVDGFMEWVDRKKPCVGTQYQLSRDNREFHYFRCMDFIVPYLRELRLIKVWQWPDDEKRGREYRWEIEGLPLLAMVSDLYENTDIDEDEDADTDVDAQMIADMDDIVHYGYKAYFDRLMQGQKSSSLLRLFGDENAQNQERMIDLEVSVRHTDCIRIIRMNQEDFLYDLHLLIQEAVEFDNDHLFEFSIGSGMMRKTYTLSETMNSNRQLTVESTRLKDLELCKGQKFTYLFDFGDMWWFDIKILEIRESAAEESRVIKALNNAPVQYPIYEEETF